LQIILASLGGTEALTATQLFLHVTTSTATSNTATVILEYQPLF
jgi:hypothetical protein